MGRQFKPGQLRTGSLYNISASYAVTASFALNGGGTNINTGSFVITSSFNAFTASYTTGSFTGSFTGNLIGSSSFAGTASYVQTAQTASYVLNAVSSSFSSTASYLNTLNQDLTFNGNLTLNGTASISFLNVSYESASVIYSSGSNQFGDAVNDVQTLIGQTIVSGSLNVTGSANLPSITGSLFGTASWAINAVSASFAPNYVLTSTTSSMLAPYVLTSSTASMTVLSSSFSTTASFATNALTASFASTVPASGVIGLNLSQIATGSVTASVSPTQFTVTSASITEFTVTGTGVTIGNAITDTHRVTGSLAITGSTNITGPLTATQIGVGAAPSGSVPLDVRAQGALSTDLALRVRNSANTFNLLELSGNGNFRVRNNSNVNLLSVINGDNVAIGLNSQATLNYGTALGNSASVTCNGGVAIGLASSTSGGDIVNPQIAIGMGVGTSQPYAVMIGASYSLSTVNTNNIANSFMLKLGPTSAGANFQHFFVNSNTNLVLRSGTQLTASVHYETAATNTITIHSGSVPTTTVSGAFQMYAATGSLTDNTRPHFRTGNGTTVWLGDESRLFNVTASRTIISSSQNTSSGSSLTVYGSGSAQPVFTVQGSQGELFSITDSLSGSLFSVNDISGLPILEVFSDNTTLIGNYLDPMLITTAKVTQTNSGSFVLYSLPTASYDTAFYDYSIRSGSNARAGQIMAIQSGSSVNFTETTTTDFGNTTAVSFTVIVSGSNMVLTGSATTGSWTTKCIIRGL